MGVWLRPPTLKYEDMFLKLQREAREDRRGLVLGSPVQLELYFLDPPLSVPALNLCLQLLGGFPA